MAKKSTGRPNAGRTKNLPRVKPEAHAALVRVASKKKQSLAETVEDAAFNLEEKEGK